MSTEIRWCPNCDEPKELNINNFNKNQKTGGYTLTCSKCLNEKFTKKYTEKTLRDELLKESKWKYTDDDISDELAAKYMAAAESINNKHIIKEIILN